MRFIKDQAFDFSAAGGDVAVLIGMNGSGKSQVMELIAEVFTYLERKQRSDFRVRESLGYDFRISYQLASARVKVVVASVKQPWAEYVERRRPSGPPHRALD